MFKNEPKDQTRVIPLESRIFHLHLTDIVLSDTPKIERKPSINWWQLGIFITIICSIIVGGSVLFVATLPTTITAVCQSDPAYCKEIQKEIAERAKKVTTQVEKESNK